MVRLPLRPQPLPPPAETPPPVTSAAKSRRILIVEDNPDGRETLRLLLQLWQHKVEAAVDGQDGVAKALAWRPDVALVDIGLPVLDGYQVARQLRAAFGDRIRLLAMTGYGQFHDSRRAGKRASIITSSSRWTPTNCSTSSPSDGERRPWSERNV